MLRTVYVPGPSGNSCSSSMSGDEEIKRIGAILNQIITSGIKEESLPGLMEKFERGITYTGIQRPCTIGD